MEVYFLTDGKREDGEGVWIAEIMLANGQILPIDDIDIFDNPKKKKDDED